MRKPAPADHPIHELLRDRWSPRAFSGELVSPDVLQSLFEAARWSASCFNDQPWRFIVATGDQRVPFQKVLSVLTDANRSWVQNAPAAGIAAASRIFDHNGQPNRHAAHDVGAALAQLTVEATSRGLAVHLMAGFDPEAARTVFGIPEHYEAITAFALGYPGDPSLLAEPYRTREQNPRVRKPLSEIVFADSWDEPAAWAATD